MNWKLAIRSHCQMDFLSGSPLLPHQNENLDVKEQYLHMHTHVCTCMSYMYACHFYISRFMLWTKLKIKWLVNSLGKGQFLLLLLNLGWRRKMRWEGKKRKAEEFVGFVQVHPHIKQGQTRSDREITLSRPPPFCKTSPIISGGRNSKLTDFWSQLQCCHGGGERKRRGVTGRGQSLRRGERGEQHWGHRQGVSSSSCSVASAHRHSKCRCSAWMHSEKEHFINSALNHGRAGKIQPVRLLRGGCLRCITWCFPQPSFALLKCRRLH